MWGNTLIEMKRPLFSCIAISKHFFFLLQTKYNYHHIKLKNYIDINGFLYNYVSDMTENNFKKLLFAENNLFLLFFLIIPSF